jgi:hypothetical protein
MRRRLAIGIAVVFLLLTIVLALPPRAPGPRGMTWLELTDAGTGRVIFSGALAYGEEIVLTWKNSLFGLRVTEGFAARGGRLDLTRVAFADSQGSPPPLARPEDLDDLYQTGGAFQVDGLARPFTRAVFRIGDIGNPKFTIGHQTVDLKQEAGFGGVVLLQARKPKLRLEGSLREAHAYLQDLILGGLF